MSATNVYLCESEAAVIVTPHIKWQERLLACVVLKEGMAASEEVLLAFLESQFEKCWVPEDVVFLDEIPKTAVGKFLKAKLRDNMAEIYPKLASFV